MTNLPTFSALAGAVLAVASTTFNAQAEAVHPILDYTTHATGYRAQLSSAFTSGEVEQRIVEQNIDLKGMDLGLLAGGAVVTLEDALKAPMDRPRTVFYPGANSTAESVVGFVIPPQGKYAREPIGVCLAGAGGLMPLWKGHIMPTGQVVADYSSPPNLPVYTNNPCSGWLVATGKAWMQQQGVPVKAQDAAKQ